MSPHGLRIAVLCAAALLCASCGAEGLGTGLNESQAPLQATGQPTIDEFSAARLGLPPLPAADPLRWQPPRTSSFNDLLSFSGDQAADYSHNAIPRSNSKTLKLSPASDALSYGVYTFEGLAPTDKLGLLSVALTGADNGDYYIALSDYAYKKWEFHPFTPAGASDTFNLQIGPAQDYVNASGSFSVAVLAYDGLAASIAQVQLIVGDLLLPPSNFTASSGMFWDKVALSWDVVDGADEYRIYYKQIDQGDEYYDLLTVISGGSKNSFNHTRMAPVAEECAHDVHYAYRIISVQDGQPSPVYSSVAEGWRQVPTVSGVSASDGEFALKTIVSWEALTGLSGADISYNVYYQADDTLHYSPKQPALLASAIDGTEFEHLSTDTKKAKYGVAYRYFVTAVADGDESPDMGSFDLGTRVLGQAPANFSASDGSFPDRVRLSWELALSEPVVIDGYDIYRDSADAPFATTDTPDTFYDDLSPTDSTEHEYWVLPQTSEGPGVESAHDGGSIVQWLIHNARTPQAGFDLQGLSVMRLNATQGFSYRDPGATDSVYFCYSDVPEPTANPDWSSSRVNNDPQLPAALLTSCVEYNSVPWVAWYADSSDDQLDGLRISFADSAAPASPADWSTYTLFAGHVDFGPVLADVNGRLALIYAVKTSGEIGNLYYARAQNADPQSAADWSISEIFNGAAQSPDEKAPNAFCIAEVNGDAGIGFASGKNLYYVLPNTEAPAAPEDWDSSRANNSSAVAKINWVDLTAGSSYVAMAYQGELDPTHKPVRFTRADILSPFQNNQWTDYELYGAGESNGACALGFWNDAPIVSFYSGIGTPLGNGGAISIYRALSPEAPDAADWVSYEIPFDGSEGYSTAAGTPGPPMQMLIHRGNPAVFLPLQFEFNPTIAYLRVPQA